MMAWSVLSVHCRPLLSSTRCFFPNTCECQVVMAMNVPHIVQIIKQFLILFASNTHMHTHSHTHMHTHTCTHTKHTSTHLLWHRPTALTNQSQAVRFWIAPAAASMDTGLVQVFNTDRYSSSKSLPHSARYSVEEAGKFGADLGDRWEKRLHVEY